jgi:hypothetical protein
MGGPVGAVKTLDSIRMARIKWHYIIDKVPDDTQLVGSDFFDDAPGQLITAIAVVMSSVAWREGLF